MEKMNFLPCAFVFFMAFTGGFADAASFILIGTFSGHLTGNSILSLIWVIDSNYRAFFVSVTALIGFIVGTILGIIWRKNIKQEKNMYLPMICQLALVIIIIIIKKLSGEAMISNYIFAFGLSFSLGIQNGVYNRILKTNIHTTYITGITTSLFEALLYTDKSNLDKVFNKKIFALISSGFVFGAGTGAFMTHHFNIDGFMLIILLISISTILCYLFSNKT